MRKLLPSALLMITLSIMVSCNKKCEDHRKGDGCIDQSRIRKDAICTKEYDPVCGCDGKTYGNPCEASSAGVVKFVKGACGGATTK